MKTFLKFALIFLLAIISLNAKSQTNYKFFHTLGVYEYYINTSSISGPQNQRKVTMMRNTLVPNEFQSALQNYTINCATNEYTLISATDFTEANLKGSKTERAITPTPRSTLTVPDGYFARLGKAVCQPVDTPTANNQQGVFPFEAVLTCGMGMPDHINILACFAKREYGTDTELTLTNGNSTNVYKAINLLTAGVEQRDGFHIKLQKNFSITAQNSDKTLMLGMIIKDSQSGKVLFQKQVGQYGTVSAKN